MLPPTLPALMPDTAAAFYARDMLPPCAYSVVTSFISPPQSPL